MGKKAGEKASRQRSFFDDIDKNKSNDAKKDINNIVEEDSQEMVVFPTGIGKTYYTIKMLEKFINQKDNNISIDDIAKNFEDRISEIIEAKLSEFKEESAIKESKEDCYIKEECNNNYASNLFAGAGGLVNINKILNNTMEVNNERIEIKKDCEYRVVNNLKELLIKKGLSQVQIAEVIGISSKTMSNIVSNRYNTSLDVALKISYILNEPMDNIFRLEKVENIDK